MSLRASAPIFTCFRKNVKYLLKHSGEKFDQLPRRTVCALKEASNVTLKPCQGVSRFTSDSAPAKCWNCSFAFKSDLFCSKCKALQEPPEKLNYFNIIGVKEGYDVDVNEVQRKYRQLQRMLHPDKFGNKSEKEKELSESLSSLVNKAYGTLLNPLDRGLYLLKLKGVTIPEGTTSLDPEFLMEIMEKNEQIEEASRDRQKAFQLLEENRETLSSLSKKIGEAFSTNDIDKAKSLLTKMKYYVSIEGRLKIIKDNLGIVE